MLVYHTCGNCTGCRNDDLFRCCHVDDTRCGGVTIGGCDHGGGMSKLFSGGFSGAEKKLLYSTVGTSVS